MCICRSTKGNDNGKKSFHSIHVPYYGKNIYPYVDSGREFVAQIYSDYVICILGICIYTMVFEYSTHSHGTSYSSTSLHKSVQYSSIVGLYDRMLVSYSTNGYAWRTPRNAWPIKEQGEARYEQHKRPAPSHEPAYTDPGKFTTHAWSERQRS